MEFEERNIDVIYFGLLSHGRFFITWEIDFYQMGDLFLSQGRFIFIAWEIYFDQMGDL